MKVFIFGDFLELYLNRKAYISNLRAEYERQRQRKRRYFMVFLIASFIFSAVILVAADMNNINIALIAIVGWAISIVSLPRILLKFPNMSLDDIEREVIESASIRYGKRLEVLEALNSGKIVGVKFIDEPNLAAVFYIKGVSEEIFPIVMNLHGKPLAEERLSGYVKIDVDNQMLMYYFKKKPPCNVILDVAAPLELPLGAPGKGKVFRKEVDSMGCKNNDN